MTDCSLRPSDWSRRADPDGQQRTRFDSGGSIGGIQDTDRNLMVPTNFSHIVVGAGRGTWYRTIQQKIEEANIPASFGTKKSCFQKMQ